MIFTVNDVDRARFIKDSDSQLDLINRLIVSRGTLQYFQYDIINNLLKNPSLTEEAQQLMADHQIYYVSMEDIHCIILYPYLNPNIFVSCFTELLSSNTYYTLWTQSLIMDKLKNGFQYHNPDTQKLLETALLLG